MILPGVYLPEGVQPTAFRRARAVSVWSRGRATLAGLSAAAVWGAKWIDDDDNAACNHVRGPENDEYSWVEVYRERLEPGDRLRRHGMLVTSPARTAYDVGRRLEIDRGVEVVDALYQTGKLTKRELAAYAEAHPARRGVRRLREVIALSDEGAESPMETCTRLAIVRAGLPCPDSQIDVFLPDGSHVGRADLGWDRWWTLVDYEGDGHRGKNQLDKDVRRGNRLAKLGWTWIRVRAESLLPENIDELMDTIRDAIRVGGGPV